MAEDGRNLDQNTVTLTSGGKTSRLLKTGDLIGDSYRLKGLIGQGGMGYVFRAEHIVLCEAYALKILAPDQINETAWNRFQAEGKAIARLDHPNIVKIYNMGVDRGDCPYYVMDLLEGVALSDCIKDKMPFSLDEILNMFMQIASGLGYAHGRGIIHRDVKPSNVVLVDSGGQYPTAKIVDFGIAKLVGGSDLHNQSLTATGEIFGSPYYMSPEQCLGTEIDSRADIYSLGCTLFEVLCGRPPFVGESALQTVMMHQNKPSPTLSSVLGKFSSEEMEALVAKMLMKRPADRYQSMDQILHDLDRIWQNKAVGKNVDTGFITSVDSQLEDMGSRYEGEEQKGSRRKKILGVLILLAVVFVAAASASIFNQVNTPDARPPIATIHTDVPQSKEYGATVQKRLKDQRGLAKEVSLWKPITSTIDKVKGTRTFHCPAIHIGFLTWLRATKDHPRSGSYAQTHGQVDACGEALVPADRPIWLVVKWERNRDTFLCPDILAKFGPDELIGLELNSLAPVADFGLDDPVKFLKDQTTLLVKAISGWTNCQSFEFYNWPATDQAVIELDKHQTLQQFAVHHSDINVNVLAKRQFLQRLTSIELADVPDCDPVLVAFRGSNSIGSISLQESSVSALALKTLAGCRNLNNLHLSACRVDSSALEAICTIKSLKELVINEGRLAPEQLPTLGKLGFITHVVLDVTNWPKPKRQELRKVLPGVTLWWHPPKSEPSTDL